MVYEVTEKVSLKTRKVVSCSIKETDIKREDYMADLVEYVYQITKELN